MLNICPNINTPEAKALIKRLGLLGFYKAYIHNGYEIPVDNQNVIDPIYDDNYTPLASNGNASILFKRLQNSGLSRKEALGIYLKTQTDEFKKWFGNSKIVDENGEPELMYHSSNQEFDTFIMPSGENLDKYQDEGIYFSKNPDYYGKEGIKYPVFLSIENPTDIDHDDFMTAIDASGFRIKNLKGSYDGMITYKYHPPEFRGDEGNYHNNIFAITFNNKQIKSIYNKSSFSNKSSNIFEDISDETQSVQDKLFINKELFTANQQNEAISSIVYLIQEARSEGISSRELIKSDIIDKLKDELEFFESNFGTEDDLEARTLYTHYNNLINNFDRFFKEAETRLSFQGIKAVKAEDNLDEEEVADTEYDETEASLQKLNYEDSSVFSQSSKDTASAHLKTALSLIPKYIYKDGKIVIDEDGDPVKELNYLNLEKFEDLDIIWNDLLYSLLDIPIGEKLDFLKNSDNPRHNTIYRHIVEDKNTNIQNEFESVFSKQQAKFITINFQKADNTGRRSILVFDTNRMNANNLLVDDWYNSFIESNVVVTDVNGNQVIDITKGQEYLDRYNSIVSIIKSDYPKAIEATYRLLNEIGITISKKALETNGIYVNKELVTVPEIIQDKLKYLFNRLAGNVDESSKVIEDELQKNNPFIEETSSLELLARLENKVNPSLFEASFISGDGKAKYSFVNNSYLSHKIRTLKSDTNYLNKLKTTGYASNSWYLNQLLSNKLFKDNFDVFYVDSLGNSTTNQPNKTFKLMNTKEKEITRTSLFQNAGRSTSGRLSDIGYFIGLIPSDKTTLPIFKALKVPVRYNSTDASGVYFNQDTIDVIYDQFVSEYNRVRQTINEIGDPNVNQIADYHTGAKAGSKFIVFDFLNKHLIQDGNLLNLDTNRINTIVKPELIKFLRDLTNKQISYWKNLDIYNADLFDKSYRSNKGYSKDENIDDHLEKFAADYAINQFVFMMNQTQLISGDPALHGKSSIEKTWINYYKRMAKDIAPGLDGNFETDNFNTLFLKDLNYSSAHLVEYMKVLGDKVGSTYGKINPADAQEYTTLEEHIEVMKAYGRLTPEMQEAADRLIAGGEFEADIQLILQPVKPVYVQDQIEGSIDKFYYIKTSSFPLIPALVKGLEIEKLANVMRANDIQRAVYESGVKLGLQGDISVVSNDGIIFNNLDVNPKQIINLPRSGFRIQMELPFHGDHTHIGEGSQGRKLILNNLLDDEIIEYNGSQIDGKTAKQIFEDLHIERVNRSFDKLLLDLGFDESGRLVDISKIQSELQKIAEERDYPINDIYSIQVVTEDGKKRFKVPLGFNNSATRFESLLNSLVTNRVVKQELPGFSKVQGSGSGFTKVIGYDETSQLTRDSIVWLDKSDTKLNYITEKDGRLVSADILVPSWFKDKSGNDIDVTQFVTNEGILDTTKLPEELLTIIGLRIPTQGYNSMMKFRVKGFLPELVGDLAIVPAEITVQMGSDFDVDKLFIYSYNYNVDADGKISKIKPNFIEKSSKSDDSKYGSFGNKHQYDLFIKGGLEAVIEDLRKQDKVSDDRGKQLQDEVDMLTRFEELNSKKTIDNTEANELIELYAKLKNAKELDFEYSLKELNLPNEYKAPIKQINYSNIDYSKLDDKQIENAIVQMFEDRLSDVKLFDQILEPNGFGSLPEVANKVDKLVDRLKGIHTFTTVEQNSIHAINNSGKLGTAQYSLFSTFFKASQDAKLRLNKPIKFKNSKDQVVELSDLYEINNIEGNKRSNVIMYLQSAAVDNAKEQILGKLNINDKTMGVSGVMAMLGLPEDFIGYFLSQPSIREYTEGLLNANDIITGKYDPFLASKISDSLITKYRTELGLQDGESFETDVVLSANLLENQLSNYSPDVQLVALGQFYELLLLADTVRNIQSSINTDTNGLGASYTSVIAKNQQIKNLLDNSSKDNFPILGVDRLFENNTIGKSKEVVNRFEAMMANILPNTSIAYTTAISKILEGVGLVPSENNLKDLYSNIKSYILSSKNFLDISDVDLIRDSLLYGKENIAKRWLDYSKTSLGKKNILTKRIKAKIAKNKNDFNGLEALNTPASNSPVDINTSIMYFYDMINSTENGESKLAEDIVKYFILTGSQYGPRSIGKYISYDVLEKYNFSKKLRNIEDSFNNGQVLLGFVDQYFQNNPFKAKSYNLAAHPENIVLPFGIGELSTDTGLASHFVSYDQSKSEAVLYKKGARVEGTTDYVYSKLPILGDKVLKKYNFEKVEIKEDLSREDQQVPTQTTTTSTIAKTTEEIIREKYNFDGGVDQVLKNIISKGSNNEFKQIATDILSRLQNFDTVALNASTEISGNGQYNSNTKTISINFSLVRTDAKFEEVFLHEMLHAGTVNKLDSTNLSREEQIAVNKINTLFKEYQRAYPDQAKLARYLDAFEKNKQGIATEQESIFLRDNKSELYALTNVKEFVAAGLTNPNFRSTLKANNFWKRFINLIGQLLGLNATDLDVLYNTTIDLLGDNTGSSISEDIRDPDPVFVSERNRFLTNFNTSIGKKITPETLKKWQDYIKDHDGYQHIKLSTWNGELRISKKEIVYQDIADKTPEDIFIDRIISRFKNSLKKFQDRRKQLGDKASPELEIKIRDIANKIAKLEEEKSIISIITAAEERIQYIKKDIGNSTNADNIADYRNYLIEFQKINDQIELDEESELGKEYSTRLNNIAAEAVKLLKRVRSKEIDLIQSVLNSKLDIPLDLRSSLEKGLTDVKAGESGFLDFSQSSSDIIQSIGYLIEQAKFEANQEHDAFAKEFTPILKDYLAKYKNYNMLLQKDINGNPTGYLLNKYSQEYYDKSKGNWKFYNSNTKVELTEEGKKAFKRDLKIAEENSTADQFNQWLLANSPESFITDWKKGKKPIATGARRYLEIKPIDKWIDPGYARLKALGEDDSAVKFYNHIEPILRRLNKKYGQQVNYIPEQSKTTLDYFLGGKFKGGLDNMKGSLIESLSVELHDSKGELDEFTGEPRLSIPTYMFSNKLTADKKSTDLAAIVEAATYQESMLRYKHELEPLLNIYYSVLKDTKQFLKYDNDGKPILVDKAANNLLDQSNYLIQSWLYNKTREVEGVGSKIGVDKEGNDRYISASKVTDTLIDYVRKKGMAFNPFSAIGNVVQGLTSNYIYATGSKDFTQSDYFKATATMLHSIAGKTTEAKKIGKLIQKFDMFTKANELTFGKSREVKSTEHSLNNLSWFELQERGEYFIQGQTLLAFLYNKKIKVGDKEVSYYEAFDENGNWNKAYGENPLSNKQELFKFTQKIRSAIIDVHGNYTREIQNKKHFYWRAAMIFRTWIPQAINTRFGIQQTDILSGVTKKGRYRSYNSFIRDEDGQINFQAIKDNLIYLLGGDKSSLSDLDKSNMRRNIAEIAMIGALTIMIMGLKAAIGDDDEEDRLYSTYILNSMIRAQNDLTFFMSPASFETIIKDPIPLMGVLTDTIDLAEAGFATITGDPVYKSGPRKGNSRLIKEIGDNFPFWTQLDKNLTYAKQVF